MIKIVLYTFNKRENSTKRPTGGLEVTGSIKAPTSMINPTIEFATGQIAPANLNYAYIADFGRYYFIEDWVFNDRTWTARMKVDVLATYKNVIGASTQYVTRSSSLWNEALADAYYPLTTLTSRTVTGYDYPFGAGGYALSGCFVLSTSGIATEGTGANYFLLNKSQMQRFLNQLYGLDSNWYRVEGVADGLMKQISNPIQYINGCMYIPVAYNSVVESLSIDAVDVQSITFGFWGVNVNAKLLKNRAVYKSSTTINFNNHPQISRGKWLNTEPYTQRKLYYPGFGLLALNTDTDIMMKSSIGLIVSLDLISGLAELFVGNYPNQLLTGDGIHAVYQSQLGVPINISQKTEDVLGMVSSAISASSSAFMVAAGNPTGAFGLANDILDYASKMSPNVTTLTGGGTTQYGYEAIMLMEIFSYVADDDVEDCGRPLCQDVRISTLNGFIKCLDADVEISGTSNENQEIKSYMESGFFYE